MSGHDDLVDRIADLVGRRARLQRLFRQRGQHRRSRRGAPFSPISAYRPRRRRSLATASPGSNGCAAASCRRLVPVAAGQPATIPLRGAPGGDGDVAPRRRRRRGARRPRSAGSARVGAAAPGARLSPACRRGRRAEQRSDAHRRAGALLGAARVRGRARVPGASPPSSTASARAAISASAPMPTRARRRPAPARSALPSSASARCMRCSQPTAAKISPYSPSSRLFLETLHIDPSAVPGFAGSRAARLLAEAAPRIAALREAALVDHAGVWSVLRPVLDALCADIRARGGDPAFEAFRRELGEPLEAHATFEALSEHFRAEGAWWPGDWPEAYRSLRLGGGAPLPRRACRARRVPRLAAMARRHAARGRLRRAPTRPA